MVPVWFQSLKFQKEFGSRLAPTFATGIIFFALAWWNRDLLTDWLALLQEEGRLESAAARFLAGEIPFRQFFFSDTPGALFMQALASKIGISGRYLHLMAASGAAAIVFHWSAGWGVWARSTLFLLLLTWSFSLWNVSHSLWPALLAVLLGIGFMRAGRSVLAGLLFGTAFWFHQQAGLAAMAGAGVFTIFIRRAGGSLLLACAASIFLPWAAIGLVQPDLVKLALSQIEWLPARPLSNLPKQVVGAPLVVLGLWLLSLYFIRSGQRIRGLSILAVLAYAAVGWMREGRIFLLGCFFLFSLLVWAVVPLLAIREQKEARDEILLIWFPAALLFLLLSGDFPPFLQLFPLAGFFLVWGLNRLSAHYNWLPRWWFFAPAFLLLAGGLVHQSRLLFLRAYASADSIGRLSYGEVSQVSRELTAAKEYLLAQDRPPGILVLPAAPFFYPYSGLRNLTPFDEVTEEAVAQKALPAFVQSGGKLLVVKGQPPAFLSAEIRKSFSLAKSFGHFSVWRLNGNEN